MKIKDYLSKIGRKGGTNRMALLTKAQKTELALKGVLGRRGRKTGDKALESSHKAK